ncbi:MAG: hypothetical protein NTY99_03875, partial [DPANN group archaeon]|nr:hypothetical protein [DPANN group archaeon]
MPTMYGQAGSYMTAMDPNKAPSNIQWANEYLGASTSLEPGKAMKDLLSLPASGIENVEVSVIDPQKFESMPREMFSEVRRLGKLLIHDFTKDGRPTPISVHAPMMEATGFSENKFDENQWRATQQHLNSIVEKAALVGPNVPLNIHASQLPADQNIYDKKRAEKYLKELYTHATLIAPGHEDEVLNSPHYKYTVEMLRKNEIPEVMIAVEPMTGQLVPLQAKDHVYPSGETRRLFPIEQLEMANRSEWDNISNKFKGYWKEMEEAKMNEQRPDIAGTKKAAEWEHYYDAYKDEFEREALSIFQRINKTAPEVAKNLQKQLKGVPERDQLFQLANAFKDMPAPPARLYIPAEEFVLPKAAETFASAAMRSYDISSKPSKEMKEAG